MAISEHSRHDLHSRLEALLGADAAATLMEHLPPVGWGDVATKAAVRQDIEMLQRDIEGLEQRMDLKLDRLSAEMKAELHEAIGSAVTGQTRTLAFTVIASNVTMAAIAFAAAGLR